MRLLFDQNVPAPLRHFLTGHETVLARERDWARLKNGELLAAAEAAGFDVLVTADRNMRHQQNPTGRRIGIVVLPTQDMATLQAGLAALLAVIEAVGQGGCRELDLPRPPLRRRPPPQGTS